MGESTDAEQPLIVDDRLGRNLLFTTALIRVTGPYGSGSGTGFFYDASVGSRANESIPVLVTNRHVVEHASSGDFQMIREGQPGQPQLGSAVKIAFTAEDWTLHPDPEIDVAVVAIGGVLNDLRERDQAVFMRQITHQLLPTPDVIDDLDVMEPVVFVGYPSGLHDTKNLTPIIRRGTTATPVQLDHGGKPEFLIDASVFPGSSGSPVFLVQEGSYREGDHYVLSGGLRVLFLGIVAAVHKRTVSGQLIVATSLNVEVDELIDLGVVYKWSAIDEAVTHLLELRGIDR